MSEGNQIYLPESFTALYVPPGKIKPSIGQREMAERLDRERQQQEMLATQPYMVWFKDPEGHLISANANLIDKGHQLAQAGWLEKVDVQSMPWNFFDRSSQQSSRPEL